MDATALPRPRRKRTAGRLILGCLIVLACSAGATAAVVLGQVHGLRNALSQNGALKLPSGALAGAGWGDPQTLLLVGDDQRSLTGAFKDYGHAVLPHANEMLLVRIDPSKPYISMMSIPREMMVTIRPPHQAPITNRFNYAYTAGGIPLLVSTIKQVTGLAVNHVMVVTFGRFQRAVDEMGCVYSTVDQRYYHVNVPGSDQYQEINLQPGYQDMCGKQALEFVSYRHSDTSLVRDARDQSFLLDVKRQYGSTLSSNVGRFERIFGRAVQTDRGLQSTSGLLNLIGTLISSAGRSVRQVPFQVDLTPTDPRATACECVTASPQEVSASVRAFLHGSATIPRQSTAATAHSVRGKKAAARLPLTRVGAASVADARSAAKRLPFTYEYPRVEDRSGSAEPIYLRNYLIHAPGHVAYPIYDAVFSAGQLGQYYDVQGTTWTSAPLLHSPQQTVRAGGRTYDLFYSGQHLEVVAWSEHHAAYWIRNSLNDAVPNGELLAIAEQTEPMSVTPAAGSAAIRPRTRLKASAAPHRVAPKPAHADLSETLGLIGGLVALIAMPSLGVIWLRRRRALKGVTARLDAGSDRQAALLSALGREPGDVPYTEPPRVRWHEEAMELVNER